MDAYVYEPGYLTDDWGHLSIAGNAAKAELLWPVVAGQLGLPL